MSQRKEIIPQGLLFGKAKKVFYYKSFELISDVEKIRSLLIGLIVLEFIFSLSQQRRFMRQAFEEKLS